MRNGQLLVISGPSGSGKGTIIKELLDQTPDMQLSVSATTRVPRPGEEHGTHYYFIGKDEFQSKIENGEMLEYVEYIGNYYGTPKAPVDSCLEAGKDILLEIEVTGGKNIRRLAPEAILIFVVPPSLEQLRERLTGRGTEDADVVEKRLAVAKQELLEYTHYDYVVVNDTVESCVKQIQSIIAAGQQRSRNMAKFIERVIRDVETCTE